MKALRFVDGVLGVLDVKRPGPDGECLVRILKSGICNTDLEIVRGYGGFDGTLGHEFVGIVEQSAEKPELIGQRVVGEINVGCGRCSVCKTGGARHCPERTVLGIKGRDGSHAEYLTLPTHNLFPIPTNVPDEHAVFVEPLAAAIGITEHVDIRPETKVAVVGDGKLGILCARSLAIRSRNVVAIGKHAEKLALAEKSGVETVLVRNTGKLSARFDVVIEASGSESGFAVALDLVKPRGRIVLKSTFQAKPRLEAWRIVVNEISVIGSRCGRFEPALAMLANGSVDVSDLISEQYALTDGVLAMKRAAENGVMKVLLNVS